MRREFAAGAECYGDYRSQGLIRSQYIGFKGVLCPVKRTMVIMPIMSRSWGGRFLREPEFGLPPANQQMAVYDRTVENAVGDFLISAFGPPAIQAYKKRKTLLFHVNVHQMICASLNITMQKYVHFITFSQYFKKVHPLITRRSLCG